MTRRSQASLTSRSASKRPGERVDGQLIAAGLRVEEDTSTQLNDLRKGWERTIRIPLAAFALSDPSRQVRDLATELDVPVEWVLIRGVSLVRDVIAGRDFDAVQAMVWSHYRDAQRLVDELHCCDSP